MLRRLWTEESVTVTAGSTSITAAGLAPLPVQRPIPIWLGAPSPAALRRVGRVADGWFPQARPGGGLATRSRSSPKAAREVGPDPAHIAFEGRVNYTPGDPDLIAQHAEKWREAGASHLSVNTMAAGLQGVDAHINAISLFASAVDLAPGTGMPSSTTGPRR